MLPARLSTSGSYATKDARQIRGSGYVVDSLEAALWCFNAATSYKETVLLAANPGDDADTTAAIAGQLAGAFYGVAAIPAHWRASLRMRAEIEALALQLLDYREDS
jgi:ADP-ribosyl-[dinitrogen reductase] hydrolase